MATRATKTEPDWPTTMRQRLGEGLVLGTDNSVWMYRAIRLSPVVDARSIDDRDFAARPLMDAVTELSGLSRIKVRRRNAARSAYRQIHLLWVNVPALYVPPASHSNAAYLRRMFPDSLVDRRMLLMGVKLISQVTGAGMRAAVDSVVETLVSGGSPLSDYDTDKEIVGTVLARAGMSTPSTEDMRLANAWWNQGRNPDTPTLIHDDHLHVFTTVDSARTAERLGRNDCDEWPRLDGHHALTFAAVEDYDINFEPATSSSVLWAPTMMALGARAISIRARIEPTSVTRAELRRRKGQYATDLAEQAANNKMPRAEQEEMFEKISMIEAVYSVTGGGTPTLVDASTIIAFDGRITDAADMSRDTGLVLNTMLNRQDGAMTETMLASGIRSNPHLHDLPVQNIAYCGLQSLSRVGDKDGALVGFTEQDRQPAYISPVAAATADGLPMGLVVAQTGGGKSMLMLDLATQFAEIPTPDRDGRTPVVIIDPKLGSDFSGAVADSGAQVISLDQLTSSDGIFDPIRFAKRNEVGVELAASMLLSINPWGSDKDDYETPLIRALSYGVEHGGKCIGEALQISLQAGVAPQEMVGRVFDVAESSPMFRACVGMNPNSRPLSIAEGITLIKVGDAHLDLPQPGAEPEGMGQRIALALVRMMVFGTAMALTGRSGVMLIDEFWVFLGAGRAEVERLGRLARSQGVLPIGFTQRATDAIDAGLTGYISRGWIGPIQDEDEAIAACRLFNIEPSRERIRKMRAKATIGGKDNGEGTAPNWDSMRALVDPVTRRTLRGAVFIYSDLDDRAVPIEVTIPKALLLKASTNPEDIRRRRAAAEAAAAALLVKAAPVQAAPQAQQPRHAEAMAAAVDDDGWA